ncbi:MAG: hypothetical protein AAGK32_21470, partial [Actinomycetota bacterium]
MTADAPFRRLLDRCVACRGDQPALWLGGDAPLTFDDVNDLVAEAAPAWRTAARDRPPVVVVLPSVEPAWYALATAAALVGGSVLGAAAGHTADALLRRLRPDLVIGTGADLRDRLAGVGARPAGRLTSR